ncbi:MAG TPA: MMPL family transporter [Mycobacterium sp.]|nr:MMPL family transporter [Mycobacterium sp.]
MFAWWGRTVYRYRFIVIGVMVALCLGGGLFGMSLGKHVTQSGFYDDGSQSVKASVLGDDVYGRDRTSQVVATFTAPDGKTVDDPRWSKKIVGELNKLKDDHPDQVIGWAGYLAAPDTKDPVVAGMATKDKKHTFVSIPLKGDDDDTILDNYQAVLPALQELDGGTVELAGLDPIANALTGTIATDEKRMEVLALPLVAVVLFFVFGGVVAAGLPVMVGGLSIAGATGILRLVTMFGPVSFFAQPMVTLIGFGLAIDYGLFVVSRFREEIAEGYDTEAAVRRTVITAGRTVVFSAVLIIVSSASLLVLPQGFVKSLTYAIFAAVGLAALLSITLLPACLGVLAHNVDALGVRTLFRVPFLRDWPLSNRVITWFAEKTQKTKTREEVEGEFWGKLVNWVMKRPLLFAIPIVVAMILLIIPLGRLSFGGMSEKYLPPDNPTRMAQEHFDKLFPGYRTEQLTLVIKSDNNSKVTEQQVKDIAAKAAGISGFTEPTWGERPCPDVAGNPCVDGQPKDDSVRVIQNGLVNRNDAAKKISELRALPVAKGLSVWVGGTPALEQDSIHSLVVNGPLMLVLLISTTMLLMFLAFGSLVLPLKAAVMSTLTLGSTMGILTWIFVDGHFAELLNFTATPLMVVVIALVIAVGYGLATDYEVFLVSRMVEARESGMSTTESIRIGTATTGRLITAAALILAVLAGSFVFSDLVMMKYLAFGLMAALLLDATVVRMFLVPSVMKLLGDDCWWAPRWMKRVQNRIGLGEIHLPDERRRPAVHRGRQTPVGASPPAGQKPRPPHDPSRPTTEGASRPGAAERAQGRTPSTAGTTRMRTSTQGPAEPPTTRFSAQREESPAPRNRAGERPRESTAAAGGAPATAGGKAPPSTPGGGQHNDQPVSPRGSPQSSSLSDEETQAIPVPTDGSGGQPPADATEKLNIPGQADRPDNGPASGTEKPRQRRGGGGSLSAQDLLRREGRYY